MQSAEIELKFPVADPFQLEAILPGLGFRLETPRTFEHNVLYDTPNRDLRARHQLLRIRQYGDVCTLTHKRQPDGADAVIEVCGAPSVVPASMKMQRVGGHYVLGGLVSPGANVTNDATIIVKTWIKMRGIHNYHPRHLIQALDFVMTNRSRFPFKSIVDSKFQLKDLQEAFRKASERTVLRAAVVP